MRTKFSCLYRITTVIILTLISFGGYAAKDPQLAEYTVDHPLVYEDIWDLPPYTFLNKDGEPEGFNIDLIKAIMHKLDIPYIIRLRPTATAYNDLKSGKSDLMLGMHTEWHSQFGRYGKSVVSLFTHGVMRPANEPDDIETVDDLKRYKVIVQNNSFSHRKIIEYGLEDVVNPKDDINDAVQQLGSRDSGQVLWNTLSLKFMMKRHNITDMKLTPISMPNGEYRFMSNDVRLLNMIDSVYEAMTINEELQPIRNKWFYPEMKPSGIPEYVQYIAGALILLTLMLVIYNWIYHIRENNVNRINSNQNRRLSLYMRSGKLQMWAYDIERNVFTTFTPDGEVLEVYNEMGFSAFFNRDDYNAIRNALDEVSNERTESRSLPARCHKPATPEVERYFDIKISVLYRKDGRPSTLLGTQQDITEERQKHFETKNLLLKYHTVFNAVKLDMAFYDSDGFLADINDKACEVFRLSDKQELIDRRISIKDVLKDTEIDMEKPETVYASSIIKHNKTADADKGSPMPDDTRYYEMMVLPISHDNGKRLGFFAMGRDVTQLASNIREEREKDLIIKKAIERQHEYLRNINYALEISNIWLVNYYPDTKTMEITQNLKKPVLKLSQLRCVGLLDDNEKKEATRLINSMDKRSVDEFEKKVRTVFKDKKKRDVYLQINGVPIYNKEGRIDHYFGLCRNVSQLEETETKLKQEMEKARKAEIVKSAFIKNMSYEIRTPLNAVVGFAELFNMEHLPEDEPVFMDEIRKNSNLLLKLVNDILFMSRLDADMIKISTEPVDFAEIFAAHCHIGWDRGLNKGVKTVVESPYEHLVIDIDGKQLGYVIEIIASNATHFTTGGMIRGRYEYHNDELTISMEDTGVGIERHALENMFNQIDFYENVDRCSVRLSLQICKKLVEKMGGRIDLESVVGKGTTVWITIPCKATESQKKDIRI